MSSSSWNIAMVEIWLIIFQVDNSFVIFCFQMICNYLLKFVVKGTLSEDTIRNFLKQLGKRLVEKKW